MIYSLMMFIPIILLLYSISQQAILPKIGIIIILILLTVYSGAIGRKQGCAKCKMKHACPGSAAS
jgi:hypothetical protein